MTAPRDDERFTRFQHAGWQRAAPHYEQSWGSLTGLFVPALLDSVGADASTRLLDLACGLGAVAVAAQERGSRPMAIDFSSRMAAEARRRGVRAVVGDALRLPVRPGAFEAAAINFGLHHFADPEAALRRLRAALRPGGRAGYTIWAEPPENPGSRAIDTALEAHLEPMPKLPEGPDCGVFRSASGCATRLSDLGFLAATLRFEAVRADWRVPSPDSVLEAELRGGVGSRTVLSSLPSERLEEIRATLAENLAPFRDDDGYAIPMVAYVVSIAR